MGAREVGWFSISSILSKEGGVERKEGVQVGENCVKRGLQRIIVDMKKGKGNVSVV